MGESPWENIPKLKKNNTYRIANLNPVSFNMAMAVRKDKKIQQTHEEVGKRSLKPSFKHTEVP